MLFEGFQSCRKLLCSGAKILWRKRKHQSFKPGEIWAETFNKFHPSTLFSCNVVIEKVRVGQVFIFSWYKLNLRLYHTVQCTCWSWKIYIAELWQCVVVADAMDWGQLACQEGWKMCKKRRRIVMLMWCIYMWAHMSCSVVVMFTCTLVRSHPDSRRH